MGSGLQVICYLMSFSPSSHSRIIDEAGEQCILAFQLKSFAFFRLCASLGRWSLVAICLKNGCDASSRDHEAALLSMVALGTIPSSNTELGRATLVSLTPKLWKSSTVIKFLSRILRRRIEVWVSHWI